MIIIFFDKNLVSFNKYRLKKSLIPPQPFVETDSSAIPVNINLKTYSSAKKCPFSPHRFI